jgi:hypothetical protein
MFGTMTSRLVVDALEMALQSACPTRGCWHTPAGAASTPESTDWLLARHGIETFDNPRRRHSFLGFISPAEYEQAG